VSGVGGVTSDVSTNIANVVSAEGTLNRLGVGKRLSCSGYPSLSDLVNSICATSAGARGHFFALHRRPIAW
jgi:hypothetical protein